MSISFFQVLLFRNKERMKEFTPALWAAFKEMEAIFALVDKKASFRRISLNEKRTQRDTPDVELDWRKINKAIESDEWWMEAQGKYNNTFDHVKLLSQLRDLLGPQARTSIVLMVTDIELTPPKDWRYIIWHSGTTEENRGTVVSLAPIDPAYWNIDQTNRVSIVKHRMRGACCSAIGSWLKLKDCKNPRCFMSEIVDLAQLDGMVYFGDEHRIPEVSKRGFLPDGGDPAVQQEIVDMSNFEVP